MLSRCIGSSTGFRLFRSPQGPSISDFNPVSKRLWHHCFDLLPAVSRHHPRLIRVSTNKISQRRLQFLLLQNPRPTPLLQRRHHHYPPLPKHSLRSSSSLPLLRRQHIHHRPRTNHIFLPPTNFRIQPPRLTPPQRPLNRRKSRNRHRCGSWRFTTPPLYITIPPPTPALETKFATEHEPFRLTRIFRQSLTVALITSLPGLIGRLLGRANASIQSAFRFSD